MECLLCFSEYSMKLKLLDFILPNNDKMGICNSCYTMFEKINKKYCCLNCYKKNELQKCLDCIKWEMQDFVVNHRAIFYYNQEMKDYFSRFKFQGDYVLASAFSKDIKKILKNYEGFTIVPVPVSESRLLERGFNQVTSMLDVLGIEYIELFERFESQSQSQKSREERINRKQIFKLKDNIKIPSKILIIDDIYTTGSTIHLMYQLVKDKVGLEFCSLSVAR